MAWPSKDPADYQQPGRFTIPLEGDTPPRAPYRLILPFQLLGGAFGWSLGGILGADNPFAFAPFVGLFAGWLTDTVYRRRQESPVDS